MESNNNIPIQVQDNNAPPLAAGGAVTYPNQNANYPYYPPNNAQNLDLVPRQASGAALGVVGIASYVAAGLQNVVTGLILDNNIIEVGGRMVHDFTYASWFWLGITFIPSTDSGDFFISAEFPMGTEKEQTHEKMLVAQELLYKYVPEIDNVVMYEGQGDSSNFSSVSTPHYTYTHVILVPVSERKRDVHEIMLQIQEIWAAVLPDSKVSVQNGGFDKLVGYVSDGGGYGITLISEDLNVLYETANRIKEHLEADPEVVTAKLDTDFDTTTMVIDMSQEYLSSLGITSYEAGITSAILFQGMDCGRYKDIESGKRYNLRITSNITDKNIIMLFN